ncbi:GumC family protein [Qipengyuania sp. CAU 1752]
MRFSHNCKILEVLRALGVLQINDLANSEAARSGLQRYIADDSASAYQEGFSIAELRAMAWRQKKMVAILVGVAILAGLIITLLMKPLYQAGATVRIDNESLQVIEGSDVSPVISAFETDRYLNTQREMLRSRRMALAVVDSLDLTQNEAFLQSAGIDQQALGAVEISPELRRSMASAMLQQNVAMELSQQSRVATITYISENPSMAALLANGYAANFIEANVRGELENNAYAREILEDQVEQTRVELREAETAAVEYARRNGLIFAGSALGQDDGDGGAGAGASQSIAASRLAQMNQAYSQAQTERILAEQRYRTAQGTEPLNLAEARQNPTLQNLASERAKAQAELQRVRELYLAGHPKVQQAEAQVAALDAQIGSVANRVRNSLRNEYEVARRQEAELERARSRLANATLNEQDRSVQFTLLNRDAQNLRDQLKGLQQRLAQIASASDMRANNIQLIDEAGVPGAPISPNLPRNLLVSLVMGLLIGCGLAIVREATDDTLYSPDEIERKLGLAIIGTTPYVDSEEENELTDRKSAISEAYYSIRAAVDMATGGKRRKTMLITSCQPGEGKSTTSLALARDFGEVGRKVLLLDCDLRKPSVHRNLGIENENGLMDVLASDITIEQAIRRDEDKSFHYMPLGTRPANPAQILSTDLLPDLLKQLEPLYDLIVLDSSPVMGFADAPMLSRHADFTLLVAEAGRAKAGQLRAAARRLTDIGGNLTGIIVTKFDFREAGYSYDYHYGYYEYGEEGGTSNPRA